MVSNYSDEDRQRIFRESHQALQRVDQVLGGACHVREPAEALLAEALARPLEDRVERWRREADEQTAKRERFERERRRQERRPAPISWDSKLAEAIAAERAFMVELLAETIAELAERQREAISEAQRALQGELAQLKVEVAEQKVTICELRLQLSGGDHGGKTIDALALRSRAN